jgi:transcriptional regulator
MYVPAHFSETRVEVLHQLIRTQPLAALVHTGPRGLDANHIPMLIDGKAGAHGLLRGHVARANPVHGEAVNGSEVLAIFQGPGHYISPNWYPSKQAHGKDVPTWNYIVVHARGRIEWHAEADWLLNLVSALTNANEAHREQPWQVSDAPADYIDRMLKSIVGFEIPIDELTGKWKLSQNRKPEDRSGAIAGLAAETGDKAREIANRMREIDHRDT